MSIDHVLKPIDTLLEDLPGNWQRRSDDATLPIVLEGYDQEEQIIFSFMTMQCKQSSVMITRVSVDDDIEIVAHERVPWGHEADRLIEAMEELYREPIT